MYNSGGFGSLVNGFTNGTAAGTSSTGIGFSELTLGNSSPSSYEYDLTSNGTGSNFGFGSNGAVLPGAYPDTTDTFTFYTKTSPGQPVVYGTFAFSVDGSGDDILTFDPLSTSRAFGPTPSVSLRWRSSSF